MTDDIVITGGGTDGGIYALDAETGDVVWDVPTPDRCWQLVAVMRWRWSALVTESECDRLTPTYES